MKDSTTDKEIALWRRVIGASIFFGIAIYLLAIDAPVKISNIASWLYLSTIPKTIMGLCFIAVASSHLLAGQYKAQEVWAKRLSEIAACIALAFETLSRYY